MTTYIPPTAQSIKDTLKKFRIGIQGFPGTGKTGASLTFPNPLILHFDDTDLKGLIQSIPALQDLFKDKEPPHVPFYSEKFVVETLAEPLVGPVRLVNRRDAFVKWLGKENTKFTPDSTLILDSWTSMQDAFDAITFHESQKVYSKGGDENFYAPWDAKITYSSLVIDLLKSCNCNVVVIFHEQAERDKKTGELLNKLQPVMQGKFITELKRHFPYYVRQGYREKADDDGPAGYVWQVKSSDNFDCKFIGKPDRKKYIPANYNALL